MGWEEYKILFFVVAVGIVFLLGVWFQFWKRYRSSKLFIQMFDQDLDEFSSLFDLNLIDVSSEEKQRLLDGSLVFPREVFIEKANIELLEEYPPLFTGLGILGTFLGVVIGLVGFALQIDSLSSSGLEGMQSVISEMVGSVGIAFFTSLLGLLSSLICSTLVTKTIEGLDKKRTKLIHKFNQRYKKLSIEKVLTIPMPK